MPPKSSDIVTDQIGRLQSTTHTRAVSIAKRTSGAAAAAERLPTTSAAKFKLNPTAASLLGFLHAGRMTGWELAAQVQQSIGNFWNLTRSQIYRELHTLEAAGLVKSSEAGPRDRQPFALTSLGRRAFTEWISREPDVENIRFPLLLTLYFADQVPQDRLRRFLRGHQLRHERQLELYEQQATHVANWDSGSALTLRFGIEYERAVLRWFASLPHLAESRQTPARPLRRRARKHV
jgi:DNA-binding PadR family transcriptional regulator